MPTDFQANANNIYFNVKSKINPVRVTFAFDETRSQPILENPSDYEMAVVEFYVPSNSIPVMNWKNDYYKIKIQYLGNIVEEYVPFIPNSTKGPLYPNTIGQVWSYQEWCSIISSSFATLHNQMKAIDPAFPPTEPILVTIEPDTGLIRLLCPDGYRDPDVGVFLNWILETQLVIPSVQTGVDEFKLNIRDLKWNRNNYGGGGVSIWQEYDTRSLIKTLDKILVETNSVPVNPELIGATRNETIIVLTDFNASISVRDSIAIQYQPKGPIRYYQMNSQFPLHRLDFVVQWQDVDGNRYPIFLETFDRTTMKIHFRKKTANVLRSSIYQDTHKDNVI